MFENQAGEIAEAMGQPRKGKASSFILGGLLGLTFGGFVVFSFFTWAVQPFSSKQIDALISDKNAEIGRREAETIAARADLQAQTYKTESLRDSLSRQIVQLQESLDKQRNFGSYYGAMVLPIGKDTYGDEFTAIGGQMTIEAHWWKDSREPALGIEIDTCSAFGVAWSHGCSLRDMVTIGEGKYGSIATRIYEYTVHCGKIYGQDSLEVELWRRSNK